MQLTKTNKINQTKIYIYDTGVVRVRWRWPLWSETGGERNKTTANRRSRQPETADKRGRRWRRRRRRRNTIPCKMWRAMNSSLCSAFFLIMLMRRMCCVVVEREREKERGEEVGNAEDF